MVKSTKYTGKWQEHWGGGVGGGGSFGNAHAKGTTLTVHTPTLPIPTGVD